MLIIKNRQPRVRIEIESICDARFGLMPVGNGIKAKHAPVQSSHDALCIGTAAGDTANEGTSMEIEKQRERESRQGDHN